jgi:hypothetical protein
MFAGVVEVRRGLSFSGMADFAFRVWFPWAIELDGIGSLIRGLGIHILLTLSFGAFLLPATTAAAATTTRGSTLPIAFVTTLATIAGGIFIFNGFGHSRH